jgi:GAF domain-containing protein
LTLPVVTKGNVLAVAQLVNKLDIKGHPIPFTQEDQEILRTFTMFAGMTIANSKLLEFTVKAGQEAVALTNWEATSEGIGNLHRSNEGPLWPLRN